MIYVTHPALSVRHGFFGREGGFSSAPYASLNMGIQSDDDPLTIEKNKQLILSTLFPKLDLHLYLPYQKHTAEVLTLTQDCLSSATADACVTKNPKIALGIVTADCGPVLFWDPVEEVIAAAHAGWRGAVSGILENTISAMEALGAKKSSIRAVLGPTISKENYCVREDFCKEILASDPNADLFILHSTSLHFDLPGYILQRLGQHLRQENIFDVQEDTFTGPFFSCRRALSQGEKAFGCGLSVISHITI